MIHNICKGLFQIIWDYQSFWLHLWKKVSCITMPKTVLYVIEITYHLSKLKLHLIWAIHISFSPFSYWIYSYFNFFAAIIIGIVLFISFLDFSLLIPRNKISFCTQILCPITLLYSFISKCFVDPLRFSIYKITSFEIWFYVFIVLISFILISVSFSCLNFPD